MGNKIRIADYIVRFLENKGIKDVFLVSGGGAMHLVDAAGRNKHINYICNHHEQACTVAAEGYARMKNSIGAAIVTTGPGGTNAVTGIAGCWLDSIPAIVISGQVKLSDTISTCNEGLRQFGDQEINIIDIVKPITKYSVMVTEAQSVRYHLEKAFYIAMSGRKGPVWIDVPLNIQGATIDEDDLYPFEEAHKKEYSLMRDVYDLTDDVIDKILTKIENAEMPIIFAGNGIRLAGGNEDFLELIELLKIPVITSVNGNDLVTDEYEFYAGRSGIAGQRGGNFAMQLCDVMLCIGTRLMLRQIGFNYEDFAKNAYKIVVDIDPAELLKKSVNAQMPVCCDAKLFIKKMIKRLKMRNQQKDRAEKWKQKCREWHLKYNRIEKYHIEQEDYVNSYYFYDRLSDKLKKDDHIVTTNWTAYISALQALRIKQGERMIYNKALASMGYGLPAAIGACIANDRKKILCFENDGSLQMNIQELQTMVHHKLPIKLFVFNNDGYLSIKITQKNFFPDNITASTPETGVSCPDLSKIAAAYGIPFIRISSKSEINDKLDEVLHADGMFICEIIMDPWQPMIPKTSSEKLPDGRMVSKPIEDMYPFLPRDEFLEAKFV